MTRNLRVSDAAYERLATIKHDGETLGAAFSRIINQHNPFTGLNDVLAHPDVTAAIDADYRASMETIDGETPR